MQFILTLLFLFVNTAHSQSPQSTQKVEILFFGSSTCGECLQIKEKLLKPLQSQYSEVLEIKNYDIDKDTDLSLLIKLEKEFEVVNSSAQMLFFSDTFLSGYEEIMNHGRAMTESRISSVQTGSRIYTADTSMLTEFLQSKSMDWGFFAGTLVTGLADGVNPCAIATMIFLISFMATRKKKRKDILLIGLTYTATVFLTYFAMGLGLKGILEHLKGYHIISTVVRWGAFSVAALVALGSFRDAFVYRKTGDSDSIKLQLPKTIKLRIHKVISGNLSGRSLILGSIITGFLVTLLEAICTGQMYLPYIVAMTQRESLRLAGYLYLFFYNFLFVLPLLVVMVLAYFGMKWSDLAKNTRQNMTTLKILLGVVMTGLAVYLVWGLI